MVMAARRRRNPVIAYRNLLIRRAAAWILVVGFFSTSAFNTLADDSTITWGTLELPPSWIQNGPYADQGALDLVRKYLSVRMTEYRHQTLRLNGARFFYEIKMGRNLCLAGVFKTEERQSYGYFSLPVAIALPFVAVVRKDHPRLAATKEISLAELMADATLVGEFMQARYYSKEVNSLIDKNKGQAHIQVTPLASNLSLKRLMAGRIDYVLEVPDTVTYLKRLHDVDNVLTIRDVVEARHSANYSHVICVKNAWGRRVIERIDRILMQERHSLEYRDMVGSWYDAKSKRKIARLYSDFLLAQ